MTWDRTAVFHPIENSMPGQPTSARTSSFFFEQIAKPQMDAEERPDLIHILQTDSGCWVETRMKGTRVEAGDEVGGDCHHPGRIKETTAGAGRNGPTWTPSAGRASGFAAGWYL